MRSVLLTIKTLTMKFPKRVFLIDDDEDDRYIFNIVLNEFEEPIEFLHANDSESALQRLKDVSLPVPDILFLDWNMPKYSGKECLHTIKQFPHFHTIPIIVYTTSMAQEDEREALSLGASYFLSKPTSIIVLHKKLQEIFSLTGKTNHFNQLHRSIYENINNPGNRSFA
jgi:CheY-like chemotaxis protein